MFLPTANIPPLSALKALFHSIGCPVRLGQDARDGRLNPKNGVKKRRRVRLERSLGRPTVCLPETKWVRRPTHQPIKWSSTEYLAMFTHFRSHTRIIGKGSLFDFATIFTQLTAKVALDREATCNERIEWRIDFRSKLWAKNGCRFRKHRFGPLIGSKVIRDRASDGSVWSEKSLRIRPTPESDQSCVRSEADQTPEWSEKAPSLLTGNT